ncbi:MAG: hypothetical protein HY903_13185 [Deltaproteobacteria bacterium]|nr:hypothetical protein [Deltaproteobacteria bacterium]
MTSVVFAGLALVAASPTPTILVEAGTATTLGRRLCSVSGDDRVTIARGLLKAPPESVFAHLTVNAGDCEAPEALTVTVVPAVSRAPTGAYLYPNEGRLELRDKVPARTVVWWRINDEPWKAEICVATTAAPNVAGPCYVNLEPDDARTALVATSLEVLRLPPGTPAPAGTEPPELWPRDNGGASEAAVPLDLLRVPLTRFILDPPLVRATSLEAWREQSILPLDTPGVLAAVSCRPAACWQSDDGSAIVVVPPAIGESITVNARLRDRVWLRQGDALVSSATINLPLARCQLHPSVTMVLGGTEDHRLPVVLGDRCPSDLSGLAAETTPPSAAYVERVSSDGKQVEVRLGHVPRHVDTLELRLLRGATRAIVGATRVEVRSSYTPVQVNLIDPHLGEIAVIPTNREVRLQWATPDSKIAAAIVPVSLPGYYSVRDSGGEMLIRGETRTSGSLSLRFAYFPPHSQSTEPVVTFDSDVHFQVRPANVPVSLAPDHERMAELLTVVCRDGASLRERVIPPGDLVSLPYAARGSCRLRVDPGVLTPSDGTQRIRVTVVNTSPTGAPRIGGFSQVLVLTAGTDVDALWLGSNDQMRPFDHMSVTIAHDDQPGHYLTEGAASGQPARRYQMVFGDARMRIYGSATVPTGLYRIARGSGAGIIQFSAGALLRLAFLDREGREYPFDFEFALLGTNLSGRADLSVVAGVGITVPLLNPQETAQAAIGIHAWAEYSPTRTDTEGRPFAVIFGPSISFGDFGTNL